MRYFLYDIMLHLALFFLSPYYLVRMATSGKYREGLGERFGLIDHKVGQKLGPLGKGPTVWFHAVSVGEAKAVMPLLQRFKERHPGVNIVFSTVTPTGQKVAREEGCGLIDALIFLPLDLSWVVRSVMKKVDPSLFVIVEKEYWPNLIRIASGRGVPVVVVNGTVSERSFSGYSRFGWFFKNLFGRLAFYCARTEEDAKKAVTLGVNPDKVRVVGNLKFDMARPPSAVGPEELRSALGLGPEERVLVAGSTHPGEEDILLKAFVGLKGATSYIRLIIAPRHPERFDEVAELVKASGLTFSRRTEPGPGEVILLDTMGELFTAYSLATVAFVGGSLVDIGGHNLLEPAFFGRPVIFGPHTHTCTDMAELILKASAGVRVADGEGLEIALNKLLSDDDGRKAMGESGEELLSRLRGGTDATIVKLEEFLSL